jgi:hypothetical protein
LASKTLMDSYPVLTNKNFTNLDDTMCKFSNPVLLNSNPRSRDRIVDQKMDADVCSMFPALKDLRIHCLGSYISVRILFASWDVTWKAFFALNLAVVSCLTKLSMNFTNASMMDTESLKARQATV